MDTVLTINLVINRTDRYEKAVQSSKRERFTEDISLPPKTSVSKAKPSKQKQRKYTPPISTAISQFHSIS